MIYYISVGDHASTDYYSVICGLLDALAKSIYSDRDAASLTGISHTKKVIYSETYGGILTHR